MTRHLLVAPISVLLVFLVQASSEANDLFPKWHVLFDGTSLDGWTAARAKRPSPWKIEKGAMTQKDEKNMVDYCTKSEFGDYLLELDFRSLPTGDGNSGVYLRGWVEVQIFNSTVKKQASGEKLKQSDGGAIYGVGRPKANPHNEQGMWNHYTILHVGDTINVWLNGVLVQDGAKRSTNTPGHVETHPITGRRLDGKRGPVMFQGNHDKMFFRNIRLLELPNGWESIWNGKDLSEFTTRNAALDAELGTLWNVKDNAFFNPKWGSAGEDIWTKGAYGNFLLHYEYKSNPETEGGNSGFYLRDQWEIQIYGEQKLDNPHSDGSFYSIYPPKKRSRKGVSDWNVMDVKLVQNRAWVWQNGILIHDGAELNRRTDAQKPTKRFSKAPFKIQGDHGQVWFRNILIHKLPDDAEPVQ